MSSLLKKSAILSCLVFVAACSGKEASAPPQSSAPAASAAAPAAGGDTSLTVAAGDFGVPECDSYMKKYIACVDSKVPEMARGALKQALDQQKAAWKQAASTPQGKSALATGCTQAEAAAKQSMSAYGCQW